MQVVSLQLNFLLECFIVNLMKYNLFKTFFIFIEQQHHFTETTSGCLAEPFMMEFDNGLTLF